MALTKPSHEKAYPMKRIGILLLLATLGLTAGLRPPLFSQATFTIQNDSDWDIYYIYISKSTDDYWGDDLLRDQILYSKTSRAFSLREAGDYDIKLVDEDKDECVMFRQRIEGQGKWVIKNDELLECMGF